MKSPTDTSLEEPVLIRSIDQITPTWLTQRLRETGVLQRGEVISVRPGTSKFPQGAVAEITSLTLTYTPDASGNLPTQLALKCSRSEVHPEKLAAGSREVKFYQAMAGLEYHFPIPPCYAAGYDIETGHSYILMADLSATHYQTPFPIPPPVKDCNPVVESLAHIHAHWWNNASLGVTIGEPFDAVIAEAGRKRLAATVPGFMDFLGASMVPAQRRIFEQILASGFLECREERYKEMDTVTLVHGDTHTGNLLLPRDATRDKVYVVDWHLWGISVAMDDLAFMIAHRWSPQRRAALEQSLLRHYHQQLLARGVEDYDWAACWRDYREAVILTVLIPIGQFRRNSHFTVIWMGLENSLAAYEELECAELL